MQPIYVEGYAFDQKVLEGMEEHGREVAQKRVDAIGKMAKAASATLVSVVAKALTPYEGSSMPRESESVM